MGLFNKKKAEKNCCCGSSCTPEKMEQAETVKTAAGVKVLGSGCVTDFAQIAAYGVMTTPALVVDGKVVSYGKVLKKDEAKALIQKVRG